MSSLSMLTQQSMFVHVSPRLHTMPAGSVVKVGTLVQPTKQQIMLLVIKIFFMIP